MRDAKVQLRRCGCGGSAGPTGECEECRKKRVSRQPASAASHPTHAPGIVHNVLRSPGRQLDGHLRQDMETRFKHDFSRVRVHADGEAAESARAVGAAAYAVGSHIVFDQGRFAPQTDEGQRLIRHELAHVVQQGSGPHIPSRLEIGPADDALEREADRAAESQSPVAGVTAAKIQRDPPDKKKKKKEEKKESPKVYSDGTMFDGTEGAGCVKKLLDYSGGGRFEGTKTDCLTKTKDWDQIVKDCGSGNSVSPVLLMALMWIESHYGTDGGAERCANPVSYHFQEKGSLKSLTKPPDDKLPTLKESICEAARVISRDKGLKVGVWGDPVGVQTQYHAFQKLCTSSEKKK